MAQEKRIITRRDFLRSTTCAAMGGLMGLPFVGHAAGVKSKKSRVVLIRDKKVMDGRGQVRPGVLRDMLDQGVTVLFDSADPGSAWKQRFGPGDGVGIKSNVWYHLPTPEPLEEAIRSRLLDVGVKRENIAIDDRGALKNPVFRRSTALINVRPMRTHNWSGLGTLLKNYIMFVSRPSTYHGNACENLGAVWQLPHVKDKTRLNILVMLTPLFHGTGPHHFSRHYVWPYCGLIISTDPVAADATGARIIQAKRNAFFGEVKPISPPPRHIAAADTRFGLGNSRPERIHLVKVGWKKEGLI
ncbi:MAG: DUF362 domain-containing protein [Deltaproteobacteria bacterium]|nr:DUF362 domain-containing protein [Deltaproteobacteria bacterium]